MEQNYPWVDEAIKDIGVYELKGPKVRAEILEALDWADGAHDGHCLQGIHDDETPWCSSWLCGKFEEAGVKSPRSAWAQSWNAWGQGLKGPAVGCVVVFRWSPSAGHVGLVMGKSSSGSLMVLGGNQADAVNIKAFSSAQVLGYRWPTDHPLPEKIGRESLPVVTGDTAVTQFSETR